ncbi:molybdenum cofactor biosynthesis protein MoaE [Actinoallomurus sp. NPDC052308]|uniref:molybdenum cofactor biosynthesis protein MoaE n=1 Tax=Actinoallomurus TaxID=667113 RepID=UPI0031EFB318
MDVIRLAEIRDTALSVDEVLAAVTDPGAGGTALFVGTVRDEDHRRAVARLSYSAHPTAVEALRTVLEKVAAEFPVRALAATHRVGDLEIGDLAVVVAAACPHRAEAFAACRKLIDDLKAEVPIWKHQRFTDGDEEWVGTD